MTLDELKSFVEMKRLGDFKAPTTDAEYEILVKESLFNIASFLVPLDLYTDDIVTYPTVFRWITPTHFIRTPKTLAANSNELDIDEELEYAVAYDILINLTRDLEKIKFYEAKKAEVINNYQYNNYSFMEELAIYEYEQGITNE